MEKKLTEAVEWYRRERKLEEDGDEAEKEVTSNKKKYGRWRPWEKRRKDLINKKKKEEFKERNERIKERMKDWEDEKEDEDTVEKKKKYQTVVFVEHSKHSELIKRMRKKLQKIEEVGRIKVKLVERVGEKIVDILHKSDPWKNLDCQRPECWSCQSAENEFGKGNCYRRNITYETYCLTCQENIEKERKEKEDEKERTEKERERKKKKKRKMKKKKRRRRRTTKCYM